MTDLTTGAEPQAEAIAVVSLLESTPENFSISQAARALQAARYKKNDAPAEQAPVEAAPAETPQCAPRKV